MYIFYKWLFIKIDFLVYSSMNFSTQICVTNQDVEQFHHLLPQLPCAIPLWCYPPDPFSSWQSLVCFLSLYFCLLKNGNDGLIPWHLRWQKQAAKQTLRRHNFDSLKLISLSKFESCSKKIDARRGGKCPISGNIQAQEVT